MIMAIILVFTQYSMASNTLLSAEMYTTGKLTETLNYVKTVKVLYDRHSASTDIK